jgi:hypothetical protein
MFGGSPKKILPASDTREKNDSKPSDLARRSYEKLYAAC